MTNKDFESLVLEKLDNIFNDVTGLKEDVTGLKQDISRLDDKIDNSTFELRQEIKMQGAYLNQAFDRISYLYGEKNKTKIH